MDIRLRIVEDLYENDEGLTQRIRSERPDLVGELESMRSVKSALDARPTHRPAASTLQAVFDAAEMGRVDGESLKRRDRSPVGRKPTYLRSAGVATAVLAVLMAVMTVWKTDVVDIAGSEDSTSVASETQEPRSEPESFTAAEESAPPLLEQSPSSESAPSPEVRLEEETPVARDEMLDLAAASIDYRRPGNPLSAPVRVRTGRPSDILPVGMRPLESTVGGGMVEAVDLTSAQIQESDLSWDHADEVIEMYQQIEMIGGGVALGWEPPAVPLEMVSTSRQGRSSGIQPASERRMP